jgi:hypothetical protein
LSNKNFVCLSHLSHVCYMSCTFHPPWFLITLITRWRVKIVKVIICSFLCLLVISCLLVPSSQIPFRVIYQVSNLPKTVG